MGVTFIHTADWQLGKPFAGVDDPQKRARLQAERFAVLHRIGRLAQEHRAEFVLVAGDLFDSPNATKATVSEACSAIGALALPVFAIPGNHDHGGPGSLWEQEFFRREQSQLAPNFQILAAAVPVELPQAILFPCPLLRRHESVDPTAWLRALDHDHIGPSHKPRIVLAHGSVQNFGGAFPDDDGDAGPANQLDLSRIPEADFDYLALGDWHGTKQVGPKAWYAGTPELDRFVKGSDHDPGNILVVTAARREIPTVRSVRTGTIQWHERECQLDADSGLARLKEMVGTLLGTRANADLLRLTLTGTLDIESWAQLEQCLESWQARLLRLKLENQATLAPSITELAALTQRTGDPLVARVAAKLVGLMSNPDESGAIARIALRELYLSCRPR